MIKPLQNVMDLATNDAPMDAYSEWTPEGRDLLEYLDAPIFDVVGDTLIAVSSTGGKIYKMVLSTGVVSESSFNVFGSPRGVAISPNGQFFVLVTYFNIFAYETSSFSQKYFTQTHAGATRNSVFWESDSSRFVTQKTTKSIVSVNSTTWTETTYIHATNSFVTDLFNDAATGSLISGSVNISTKSIILVGGYFYINGTLDGKLTGPIPTAERDFRIKISSSGVHSSAIRSNTAPEFLLYNPSRDEIIQFRASGNSVDSFGSAINYINNSYPSTKISSVFVGNNSFRATATHLITRSLSTSPYWNYRLLTDYSLDKSLPALPDKGEGIAVGTDYTVVQQTQGFGLILNADDSIISQQNPNVTKGDTYIYVDHVYEALVNNNDRPDTGAALATPTWLDHGFINPLRMFDGKLDSVTTAPGSLNVNISASSLIGALAVFNVEAATLKVTMTDSVEGLVYDSGLIDMQGGNTVDNWFDYFFAPYIPKSDHAIIDLPAYPDATIAVEMGALNGTVKLGELVLGRTYDLGMAQYGTSVGIIDFSRKETDDFGNFKIVERRFSKRAEYDIKIDSRRISAVQRTLADMRATPAVYIGDIMREETLIYGFFRSFDIVISAPSISDATITVEGL